MFKEVMSEVDKHIQKTLEDLSPNFTKVDNVPMTQFGLAPEYIMERLIRGSVQALALQLNLVAILGAVEEMFDKQLSEVESDDSMSDKLKNKMMLKIDELSNNIKMALEEIARQQRILMPNVSRNPSIILGGS